MTPLTPAGQALLDRLAEPEDYEWGNRIEADIAKAERQAADRALAERDAAYRERNTVVQAFAWAMEDEGWHVAWGEDPSEPDWPVLYIETPQGQVSWHIPKAERVFEPPDRSGSFGPVAWDGHTTEQKYQRLAALIDKASKPEEGA